MLIRATLAHFLVDGAVARKCAASSRGKVKSIRAGTSA
jgi:hypothetical protein